MVKAKKKKPVTELKELLGEWWELIRGCVRGRLQKLVDMVMGVKDEEEKKERKKAAAAPVDLEDGGPQEPPTPEPLLTAEQIAELEAYKREVQYVPPPRPPSPKRANPLYKLNMALSRMDTLEGDMDLATEWPVPTMTPAEKLELKSDKRCIPSVVVVTGNMDRKSIPKHALGVYGVYWRLNVDINRRPCYQRMLGRCGDELYETKPSDGDVEMEPLTSFGEVVSAAQASHPSMPDEYPKFLSYCDLGYWVVGHQAGSSSGLIRCAAPLHCAPDMLRGWTVWDPSTQEYEDAPHIQCIRAGLAEQHNCQSVKHETICRRLEGRERFRASDYHPGEPEPEFNPTKTVKNSTFAFAGSAPKGPGVTATCFRCSSTASSILVVKGVGCPSCQAPRCIFCAQSESKQVVNPAYKNTPQKIEKPVEEKKKRSYEKKDPNAVKPVKTKIIDRYLYSKCKDCKSELRDFQRWDPPAQLEVQDI